MASRPSNPATLPIPTSPTAELLRRSLFLGGFAVSLLAGFSAATCLTLGIALALVVENPFRARGTKVSGMLLRSGVVLLGFGMDLPQVLRVGVNGAWMAALTIAATLAGGLLLGRWLRIGRRTSALISVGTAICGGSAIAALATVIAAVEGEIAIALGTVFLLNAAALYLFPWLGEMLSLDPSQFGVWAGVAIHDLSSVVGASSRFGLDALQMATAVKLSRTLWIVPVALAASYWLRRQQAESTVGDGQKTKVRFPWFILLFLLASLSRSLLPMVAETAPHLTTIARALLAAALFVIGAGISPKALRQVGWRPLAQGALLWLFISATSLGLLMVG